MYNRRMNLQLFADEPDPNQGGAPDPNEGQEPNGGAGGAGGEKTYTQHEFDAAMARKLKGMPSKEELSAFRDWKAKQTPEPNDKAAADAQRIAELEGRIALYENQAAAAAAGVPEPYREFVAYQAQKGVNEETDFAAAMTAYLEANPQYKAAGTNTPGAWGMPQGGGAPKEDGVTRRFREINPGIKI